MAILNKKLEDEVFRDMPTVPEDVLTFIAHKAKGSVRDLEGLLTRVVFQSSFLGVPPSLEVAHAGLPGPERPGGHRRGSPWSGSAA